MKECIPDSIADEREHMPSHYTSEEGGTWNIWYGNTISDIFLDAAAGIGHKYIIIQGLKVHSLAFFDLVPKGFPERFPRWDCINGWTTPINNEE